MSRQINQPINQVKLTNVAIIRYQYKGKRFELACYKNKVLDYRNGYENDISEVLQSERIFINVSKGQFANNNDLLKTFNTTNHNDIINIILKKGNSIQVNELERNILYEQTLQNIIVWMHNNCINPITNYSYTHHQLKNVLSNYTIQPHKPMKVQYLDAFKFIKQSNKLQIERTMMEISFIYKVQFDNQIQYEINQMNLKLDDVTNQPYLRKPIQIIKQINNNNNPSMIDNTNKITTDDNNTNDNDDTNTTNPKTIINDHNTVMLVLHIDPSFYRELNRLSQEVNGRVEITVSHILSSPSSTPDNNDNITTASATQLQHQVNVDYSNNGNTTVIDTDDDSNDSSDDKEVQNNIDKDNVADTLQSLMITSNNDDEDDDDIEQMNDNHNNNVVADDNNTKVKINDDENKDDNFKHNEKEQSDEDEESDDDDELVIMTKKQLRKARKGKNKQIIERIKKFDNDDDNDSDDNDENHNDQLRLNDNNSNQYDNDNQKVKMKKHSNKKNKRNNKGKDDNDIVNQHSTIIPQQQQQSTNTTKNTNNEKKKGNNYDKMLKADSRNEAITNTTTTPTIINNNQNIDIQQNVQNIQSCNTCGGEFTSSSLYRAHYRSDWHRYNIKLKLLGVEPISENEFLLCDSDTFFNKKN